MVKPVHVQSVLAESSVAIGGPAETIVRGSSGLCVRLTVMPTKVELKQEIEELSGSHRQAEPKQYEALERTE